MYWTWLISVRGNDYSDDRLFVIIGCVSLAASVHRHNLKLLECFPEDLRRERHILEQHSGFAFICTGCQMIFPRCDNHTSCHGKYSSSRRMEVVRRSDGMQGSWAQDELDKYTSRIDDFIRVVSPRSFRELSLHPSGRISRTPSPVAWPDRGTVPPSPRVSPEPKRSRRSRRSPSPVSPSC